MDLVSCKAAYKSLSKKIFKKSKLRIPGKRFIDASRGISYSVVFPPAPRNCNQRTFVGKN